MELVLQFKLFGKNSLKQFLTDLLSFRLTTLFLSIGFGLSIAQQVSAQDQGFLNAPKVFPPSPTAASLGKYGEVPVNLSNGTPQISIPLYELKDGEINIPISLSYYGSAIQVASKAGWVGTNWSLNAGGVITRVVKGRADELAKGYFGTFGNFSFPANRFPESFNKYDLTNQQYIDYVSIVADNWDTEPDMFYYNFQGYQGKFYFDYNRNVHLIPHNDIKIVTDVDFTSFTLTTPDGTSYSFGGPQATETTLNNITNSAFGSPLPLTNTSWYLTSFTTPNGQSATFTYNAVGSYELRLLSEEKDYFDLQVNGFCLTRPGRFISHLIQSHSTRRLATISTDQGLIEFQESTLSREDLPGDKSLAQIRVRAKGTNALLRKFDLSYYYYTSPDVFSNLKGSSLVAADQKRLMLSSVTESGAVAGPNVKQHTFEYDNTYFPSVWSASIDHYGHYNGADNLTLLPEVNTMDPNNTKANRAPNPSVINNLLLKKIIYPTKGYTQFTWDSPVVNSIPLGNTVVKNISDYDADGTLAHQKIYSYEDAAISWNAINEDYSSIEYVLTSGSGGSTLMCQYQKRSSNVYYNLGAMEGERVSYAKVTEKNDANTVNGKSIYYYYTDGDEGAHIFPFAPLTSFSWKRGLLKYREDYDASGAIKHVIRNTYDFTEKARTFSFKLGIQQFSQATRYYDIYPGGNGLNTNDVEYVRFAVISPWIKQTSKRETFFITSPLDSVSTLTNYYYGSLVHTQLTKEELTNSKGDKISTDYKYPPDMAGSPYDVNGVYTAMTTANIINPKIEVTTSRINSGTVNSIPVSLQRNNYVSLYPGKYSPDFIEVKNATQNIETRMNYVFNSQGNIQYVSKASGPSTVYLYSYGGRYPVAEIENATYSVVEAAIGGSGAVQTLRDIALPTDTYVNALLAPLWTNTALKDAKITTHTYSPLVGVSTQKDNREELTSYTYDEFQRLRLIKDHNGNILKSYNYHYKD